MVAAAWAISWVAGKYPGDKTQPAGDCGRGECSGPRSNLQVSGKKKRDGHYAKIARPPRVAARTLRRVRPCHIAGLPVLWRLEELLMACEDSQAASTAM